MIATVVSISWGRFVLSYLLSIVLVVILKFRKIDLSQKLFTATLRMTLQLMLSGLVLSWIFRQDSPYFMLAYLTLMIAFTVLRVYKQAPGLSRQFKLCILLSVSLSGLSLIAIYLIFIVQKSLLEAQYLIPVAGMTFGNLMTAVSLAVKSFSENLQTHRQEILALQGFGVHPAKILRPLCQQSLATAVLPTLNSMAGMGIVLLPGMMTGQILAGASPRDAIIYQITIMLVISAAVFIASYGTLFGGAKTLYKNSQLLIESESLGSRKQQGKV